MYAIGKSKVYQRGDYDNGETEKNAKNSDFDMAGDSPQKTNKHQVSTTAYEEFNRRTYLKF